MPKSQYGVPNWRGVYLTDGTMNVAPLDFKDEAVAGMRTGRASKASSTSVCGSIVWPKPMPITAPGKQYLTGRQEGETANPDVFYEVKYRHPKASFSTSPRQAGGAPSKTSSSPR
jgi:lactoylglutathione lyase